MRTVSIRFYHAILLLLFVTCDSFVPEPSGQLMFNESEYYVLQGSSMVIDLRSIIKQSFSTVSLSVSQEPSKGTLTHLDPFLLKYAPDPAFLEGTDHFVFTAELDNGATIKTQEITLVMKSRINDFPCGLRAIEDYARVQPNETKVIHPLANDQICDVRGPISISIYLVPKSGNAVVAGDSIIYTPGQSFSGSDELVYTVTSDGDGLVTYGILSLNKTRLEIFPISLGLNHIHFVNDSLGFVVGGSHILKTNDGGKNWVALDYPKEENEFITNFTEVSFVDENNGFVSFSSCLWSSDQDCQGGWLRTRNGGKTWKKVDFHQSVNSIFFTSPLSGFMSTSEPDFWDLILHQTVWKTVDGGDTWKEVLLPTSYFENIRVRFANENVGYAYEMEQVYKTVDGGEKWVQCLASKYVSSLVVTTENVVSASLNSTLSETTVGSIIQSDDGLSWTPVIDLPYSILVHDFSPDGNLGVAVGVTGTMESTDRGTVLLAIGINISTDEGVTWTDFNQEAYGYPQAISIPSSNVAYILCSDRIIKYSR